jgi:RNA polymerase sigma factor (sigma-70 family)
VTPREAAPATVPPEALEDAELVAMCRAGRRGAWSTLVRRYQRLVHTVPRRAGLSAEAADDVLQATFTRLFEKLDTIEDPSRVRSWLVTTARRETLDLLDVRRRDAQREIEGEGGEAAVAAVADPAPLPPELLEDLETLDRVRRAVDRLDPKARQFVELLFLTEPAPSYTEIAARLAIPVGSIGPTRARCVAKLRAILDQDDRRSDR